MTLFESDYLFEDPISKIGILWIPNSAHNVGESLKSSWALRTVAPKQSQAGLNPLQQIITPNPSVGFCPNVKAWWRRKERKEETESGNVCGGREGLAIVSEL